MPQRDEPKRMPVEERKAPPRKPEPKRESKPAPPPDEPRGPHVEEIADPDETPVPSAEPAHYGLRGGEEALARRNANFQPVDTDWDDPEFIKSRDDWMRREAALAAQKPDQTHRPFTEAYVKDVAGGTLKNVDPVRSIQPEVVSQQTPQMSDGPVVPGNMRKVEVVSTDPSVIQTQHPAGEIADGNVDLESFLDSVPGLRDFIAKNALAAAELVGEKPKAPKQTVQPLLNLDGPAWKPPKYLKHYRNDINPMKRISRRSVDTERDALFDDAFHKGEEIQFIKGHFFAQEQWQVDQLEWMRTHPARKMVGSQEMVVGGDPGIWVDDEDTDVIYCPGCRQPFASQSKMEAHYKATHGR